MVDLVALKAKVEKAREDKAELFDVYHDHWDDVIEELTRARFMHSNVVANWLGKHTAIGMVKAGDLITFLAREFGTPIPTLMESFNAGKKAA